MTVTLHNACQLLADYGGPVITLYPMYDTQDTTFKRKYWRVQKVIDVMLSSGVVVTVPEGFKTDLSSVPQWFWALFPPYGNFLLAAILHDYLYVNNIGTRKSADTEMLIWSCVLNPNQTDNFIRYKAVRWFGKRWWNHNVKFINQ